MMAPDKKFSLLRRMLQALGLSQEAADDIVNWIVDLLAGEAKSSSAQAAQFPYILREHFLTPAELNFFKTLQKVVDERALICAKVGLGDLFGVKSTDQSRFRIYTNKIDRKHVDFLLCDPLTMRPLVGIELDDKSHQREDRRERDAFVDGVYKAAGLPLLHIRVKRGYQPEELAEQLMPYLSTSQKAPLPGAVTVAPPVTPKPETVAVPAAPQCPKCSSVMILRTAKSGANAGNRFWGCSNYPSCRVMFQYEAAE